MALTLTESRLVSELRRAEREHRLATSRLDEARETMITDITRNGDIETEACVYSIAYDPGVRRFVLTTEPAAFRGLPAEELE